MARILDSIDAPDKLKLLTDEELGILAQEIRDEIIQVTDMWHQAWVLLRSSLRCTHSSILRMTGSFLM